MQCIRAGATPLDLRRPTQSTHGHGRVQGHAARRDTLTLGKGGKASDPRRLRRSATAMPGSERIGRRSLFMKRFDISVHRRMPCSKRLED
jgi:hypothetical protein